VIGGYAIKKMNRIVEEALTNMIKRIEVFEGRLDKLENKRPFPEAPKFKPGEASQSQIDYIKGLGGQFRQGMTKQEAGSYIDDLLKTKELLEREAESAQEAVKDYGEKDIHDLPKTKSKPLTKKEIEELEAEGALL